MDAGETSFISSSYWTDGIGTAAALATLEKVDQLNITDRIWHKGETFQASLQDIAAGHPACQLNISGMPATPTLSFELDENSLAVKTLYIRKMLDRGFLTSTSLYLMHAHKEKHLNKFLDSFDRVLDEMEQIITSGRLQEESNSRNQSGFARLT